MVEILGSDKKLALLNDIDKLRSYGISQYVNLPQLIVCGDQSSGKSSVLDAISGIPFPTKDNLCTRFATEVILRHASIINISVAIVPGPGRSEEEQKKLLAFRHNFDLENFPTLVDDARSCMGVTHGSSAFSTDVLRLEISGPKQPHLTIVDLPGLIHSENKLQTATDIQVVQSMVYEYMINRRSIVLAIVSAKNDYANPDRAEVGERSGSPRQADDGTYHKAGYTFCWVRKRVRFREPSAEYGYYISTRLARPEESQLRDQTALSGCSGQ